MPTFKPNKITRPWESKSEYSKGCFSSGEHVKLYHSQKWRKLRKLKLEMNPLCECEYCKKLVIPKPAQHVDHINPVKDGGDFFDMNNLQSLNRDCHNKKSAKERRK